MKKIQYTPDKYAYVRAPNALNATRFFEDVYGLRKPKVEFVEKLNDGRNVYRCKV